MYKAMIGLEMHCEISETNTKAFSSAANNYSDEPNTSVRPIDMIIGPVTIGGKYLITLLIPKALISPAKS